MANNYLQFSLRGPLRTHAESWPSRTNLMDAATREEELSEASSRLLAGEERLGLFIFIAFPHFEGVHEIGESPSPRCPPQQTRLLHSGGRRETIRRRRLHMEDYLPDLGMYLRENAKPDASFSFASVPVVELARVEKDLFSINMTMPHMGQAFAMTIDFGRPQFLELLSAMPEELAEQLVDCSVPRLSRHGRSRQSGELSAMSMDQAA